MLRKHMLAETMDGRDAETVKFVDCVPDPLNPMGFGIPLAYRQDGT